MSILSARVITAAETEQSEAKTSSTPQPKTLGDRERGARGELLSSMHAPASKPEVLREQLARNLIESLRQVERTPASGEKKAAREKERGADLVAVYKKSAPAVAMIVVAGGKGWGSGFLINKDGWLVTNHHVANEALLKEDLTREVTVIFGKMAGDYMEPIATRYTAEVYKWDRVRDLALLKVKGMPDQTTAAPQVIPISNSKVPPGEDVVAIGHAGVTLLWSMKPGEVQAVGRNAVDAPDVLRTWEELTRASLQQSFGPSLEDVKKEIQSKLGEYGNVLLVQATCPILHGDSGGPLLNMRGELVGITDFFKLDDGGGHANYFIHSDELSAFLRDQPTSPLRELRSFWDVNADACSIEDSDHDGRADTIRLYREGKVAAIGWDLASASDLKGYIVQPERASAKESEAHYDTERVFKDKAMRLQAYLFADGDSTLFAYDLDNDGYFELIRFDRDNNGKCDFELQSGGPGEPYRSKALNNSEPLWLDSSHIPKEWHARYKAIVLSLSSSEH